MILHNLMVKLQESFGKCGVPFLGVIEPDRVLSMGQIKVWYLNHEQTTCAKIKLFDHFTECKQTTKA